MLELDLQEFDATIPCDRFVLSFKILNDLQETDYAFEGQYASAILDNDLLESKMSYEFPCCYLIHQIYVQVKLFLQEKEVMKGQLTVSKSQIIQLAKCKFTFNFKQLPQPIVNATTIKLVELNLPTIILPLSQRNLFQDLILQLGEKNKSQTTTVTKQLSVFNDVSPPFRLQLLLLKGSEFAQQIQLLNGTVQQHGCQQVMISFQFEVMMLMFLDVVYWLHSFPENSKDKVYKKLTDLTEDFQPDWLMKIINGTADTEEIQDQLETIVKKIHNKKKLAEITEEYTKIAAMSGKSYTALFLITHAQFKDQGTENLYARNIDYLSTNKNFKAAPPENFPAQCPIFSFLQEADLCVQCLYSAFGDIVQYQLSTTLDDIQPLEIVANQERVAHQQLVQIDFLKQSVFDQVSTLFPIRFNDFDAKQHLVVQFFNRVSGQVAQRLDFDFLELKRILSFQQDQVVDKSKAVFYFTFKPDSKHEDVKDKKNPMMKTAIHQKNNNIVEEKKEVINVQEIDRQIQILQEVFTQQSAQIDTNQKNLVQLQKNPLNELKLNKTELSAVQKRLNLVPVYDYKDIFTQLQCKSKLELSKILLENLIKLNYLNNQNSKTQLNAKTLENEVLLEQNALIKQFETSINQIKRQLDGMTHMSMLAATNNKVQNKPNNNVMIQNSFQVIDSTQSLLENEPEDHFQNYSKISTANAYRKPPKMLANQSSASKYLDDLMNAK
ncbi:Hypothetical_protein [Hexamita inflata]|uniref:Hypothetical_protein n=1 Tax=Hexamita inflata TaxID=28002 RepID=A0AA86QMR5_9EUKA|nr:Hypothetical protein HINF_LOCUS43509 [Hexamita inflata]